MLPLLAPVLAMCPTNHARPRLYKHLALIYRTVREGSYYVCQRNKQTNASFWTGGAKVRKSRAKWKGFFRQKPGCFWSWRPSLQCMSLTYTVGLFQWNAKWSLLEPGTSPQKLAYPEQIRKHKNLYKQLASLNLWTTVCQKLSLGNIFFILDWRSNDSPTTRQQVFLFETWDTSTSILSFFFSPYNEERQRQLTSDSIYM